MKKIERRNRIILSIILVIVAVICVLSFLLDPEALITGKGSSWSLVNFALMNLAVFESVGALISGCLTTFNKKADREVRLNTHWPVRLGTIIVMAAAVVLFILTENINILPMVWADKYTWAFALLAVIQTVLLAVSGKKYESVTAAVEAVEEQAQ